MRLLSRIFGGFVLFAILVFGGVSSSFAAPKGEDCYYSDASGKICFATVGQWLDYLLYEAKCDPPAGYIDSDGKTHCCPKEDYIYSNTTTGFCECNTGYGMVFDQEIPGCVCPAGTEWFDQIGEPGCCANIVDGKCCYYYIFDKKNEKTLCFSFDEWIKLVEKMGSAGYIDDKGEFQSCPEGTRPNTQTGFCETTCAEGEYVPVGDYICTSCPDGYDCPGGTFNIINYANDQGVGDPIIYTITLNNYNNTVTHQNIYEKYATGWYSNSAATTSISTATVPSRTGYTFRGFYTSTQTDATSSGNTGTQRITKSGGLPNNTTFTANTTLYAAWAKNCEDSSNCTLTVANNGAVTYTTSCPNGYVSGEGTYNPVCQSSGTANCYRIDLDNTTNGGTGGAPTSIYMYRDATTYENSSNQSKWCKLYTDSACTTEVANYGNFYTIPTTNPTKSHATFHHYVGSNDFSSSFYMSHINYDPSYPQAWYSCIYPNEEYYGINSLGFDASQTPSLTFNAVYSCDEGWRGSCTLEYYGQTCYSNTACTASPTSTISFNANGGSGGRSGTVTATYGSMAPVITTSNWTTPHRFGYNFGGYADAQSGGNWYYGSTGSPSNVWDKTTNTTLYAQWNFFDSDKLYFYTFDNGYYSNHGACSRTSCNSLPTYSTAGFTKPTGATWLGWAFLCGDYQYCGAGDATDTGLYAAGTNVTASNVVNNFFGRWNEANNDSSFNRGLYACWQFNISYELNGGTNPGGAPTTYNNCQNTTLPTPTRDNYVFDGWYENSSFTGNPVTTIPGATTGAKIYYAKWTESPCWHTVLDNTTYGGTGGTTDIYIDKSTCNVYANAGCTGSAITALSSTPTKTNAGYTGHYNPAESGWGALITTSDSDRFTNLKTECNNNRFYSPLVAKYDCSDGYHAASSATNAACVANSYSVHFNSNCPTTASGTMSNQSFTYGTAQNLTNNGFSCTGYTFAGWATSASGAKVYDNQQSVSNLTTTNDGTFELYAKWSAETYGISYVLNGGLSVDLDTYTPVEYVSSKSANSAFSYFDTGTKFDFSKDFRVVGKFSNPNTSARHILLGSYLDANDVLNLELMASPTGAFRTWFANRDGEGNSNTTAIAANTWTGYNTYYDPVTRKSTSTTSNSSGNLTIQPFSVPQGTGEVARSMRMFMDYRTSSPAAVQYPVKMAATAMYKNNSLVNYYVPVRNSNNVCGMYDAKNDVFKASATAATFDCPSTTTMPTSFAYDTGTTISGVPVRAHSQFAGWCTNSALTQGCAMTKTIAANSTNSAQTFYAKWTCDAGYHASGNACVANSITLSWTTAHGTAPSSPSSCSYGGTFTAPAAITGITGYTFQGWSINGTTVAAGATVSCNELGLGATSGSVSMAAVWNANTYTVNYNLNDGVTLPSGYERLEYLQSSGTQYIDTGIKGNQNTKVEIKYQYHQASAVAASGRIFGSRTGSSSNAFGIGTANGQVSTDTTFFVSYDNQSYFTISDAHVNLDTWYIIIHDRTTHSINGTQYTRDYNNTPFETPQNLKVFGFDNNGTMGYGIGRVAYVKIWNGNTLVRYLIPVKYVSGNTTTYGMYDVMDSNSATAFYTNAGTGTFTAGEVTRTATYDTEFGIVAPTHPHGKFAGWNITGMDTTTHYHGTTSSNTSFNTTTLNNTTSTKFKNLRATSGTVNFTANWACDTGYSGASCTPSNYTITVSAGNGVSTVSGTGWTNTGTASMSKTYSYGDTIDLDTVITATNKTGYYGNTYSVRYSSSGSGSLSNGTFTVGAENATIIVNAEGITAPTAENVTLASNITIGTYRHNSPTLTGTVANASTDYDSGISLYYKLGYVDVSSATATCPSSGYDYTDTPSAGTDNAITLENDAFLAYRCYKVQVYATDGILTSTTTDSSNAVNLSLIQRRLKFNGNEGTVNGSTYKNGYARYGTGLLKAGYVSTTDLNPYTAVREGYAFDGWWTAATGGSQVYDANLNLTSATISGYTSGGDLVLTSNKNLYAHWTLNTCAPGLYMNNGSCVACPENHYCVGGATTAQACPANLYTPNNTIAAYHDEAGDCGRKLHIGTDVLWLRSDKKSMNSANKALNFDFFNNDGVADLFLNLSTNPSPMSSTTNKNFKMNVGGTVYYGCDDGTCQ